MPTTKKKLNEVHLSNGTWLKVPHSLTQHYPASFFSANIPSSNRLTLVDGTEMDGTFIRTFSQETRERTAGTVVVHPQGLQ